MRKLLLLSLLLLLSTSLAVAADSEKAASAASDKELTELSKEMGDFHGQAEQMMKQLEKASAASALAGQPPSALDDARRKMIRLAGDDRFLKSAQDLWNHPDRPKMLLIQLGFFIFMLIIKAWRQSKVNHWFKRMLVGFVLSIFTMVGIAYLIPAIVLGEPFIIFTSTIFRVVAYSGP